MSFIKNRLFHQTLLCFVISLCLVCLLPARASAWGESGHRIIVRIAADKFTGNTRQQIEKLLGTTTLESASIWADQRVFPSQGKGKGKGSTNTSHWHFVSLPHDAQNYVPHRDCQAADKTCLIEAIERQAAILGNEGESPARRTEALKYVLHLIGDLHQPFHVTSDYRGGNDFRVRYFGKLTNLHAVWDTDLINMLLTSARMSEAQYAQMLGSRFASDAGQWSRGTIAYWAVESRVVSREIYPSRSNTNSPAQQQNMDSSEPSISTAYNNQHKTTGEKQLAKAGFRLAQVLNSLLDPRRAR